MFRGVAVVVAVAMLSMSASAARLHVHASAGHEHSEHHHGPAAHSHAPAAHQHRHPHHDQHEATPGADTELEPCDPAHHVVPLVFACMAVEPLDAPVPPAFDARVLATPSTSTVAVVPSEVRAHSPPRITDAPLRAPPITRLA